MRYILKNNLVSYFHVAVILPQVRNSSVDVEVLVQLLTSNDAGR
jgi:hypothetical protein